MNKEKQKGVALYIVIVLLSVFITVVFTLTGVSLSQIRISWQAGDSVKAFCAADTGVERALYNIRKSGEFGNIGSTALNNASIYSVNITYTPTTATINSKGIFKKARRSIEAKY